MGRAETASEGPTLAQPLSIKISKDVSSCFWDTHLFEPSEIQLFEGSSSHLILHLSDSAAAPLAGERVSGSCDAFYRARQDYRVRRADRLLYANLVGLDGFVAIGLFLAEETLTQSSYLLARIFALGAAQALREAVTYCTAAPVTSPPTDQDLRRYCDAPPFEVHYQAIAQMFATIEATHPEEQEKEIPPGALRHTRADTSQALAQIAEALAEHQGR